MSRPVLRGPGFAEVAEIWQSLGNDAGWEFHTYRSKCAIVLRAPCGDHEVCMIARARLRPEYRNIDDTDSADWITGAGIAYLATTNLGFVLGGGALSQINSRVFKGLRHAYWLHKTRLYSNNVTAPKLLTGIFELERILHLQPKSRIGTMLARATKPQGRSAQSGIVHSLVYSVPTVLTDARTLYLIKGCLRSIFLNLAENGHAEWSAPDFQLPAEFIS